MKVDKDRVTKFLSKHPILNLFFILFATLIMAFFYLLSFISDRLVPYGFIEDLKYIVDEATKHLEAKDGRVVA